MARPRIRQFADDMRIGYDEAKNLVKKGRRRSDGGSQILEQNMKKMRDGGAQAGESYERAQEVYRIMEEDTKIGKPMLMPQSKPTRNQRQMAGDADTAYHETRREDMEYKEKVRKAIEKGRGSERKAAMGGTVYAESGKYMSCRGAGKAIQGTKFSGVK
jgi:hypothetical protein